MTHICNELTSDLTESGWYVNDRYIPAVYTCRVCGKGWSYNND